MELPVADSARKHGIDEEDMRHAVRHYLREVSSLELDRGIFLGPDRTGRLLEIAVLHPDGDAIIIHADYMRPKFLKYL